MSFPSFDFDQHLAALPTPGADAGARAAGRGSWSGASRVANCCSPGSHSPFSSSPPAFPASWRPSHEPGLQNPWQTTSCLHAEAGSSSIRPQPFPPILGERHVAPHSLEDFDEAELSMAAATNAARLGLLKDELSVIAGKITPGVDDTPYIQFALEALTREPGSHPGANAPEGGWTNARQPHVPLDEGRMLAPVTQPEPVRYLHQGASHGEPAQVDVPEQGRSPLTTTGAHLQHWIAVDRNTLQTIDPRGSTYPPLTFKPRILRPLSTAALLILCLLMMTAYVFSNRYAQHNLGLTPYPGSIYSGQYFVFRILPPLVAVIILIYSQCILTTSLRILPFTNMAQEDPRERYLALFQRLYPRTFLLPQLMGPWQLIVFDFATWLAILTVPLQSSAFTCIYVRDEWIWAPSQGVAWALVGLYALLGASTAIVTVFWLRQWTGLRWDVRSIADVVTLVSRTNTMHSYTRQTVLESRSDFKTELRDRWFDRLGYWQTGNVMAGGIWHTIGTTAMAPGGQGDTDHGRRESCEVSMASRDLALWGGRHLPLSLRDWPLVGSVLVTGGLLVALLIVCFLPQTRLDAGFLPLIPAGPNQSAFSAANFVYSFVPALLGMVMFLLFQSVDLSVRMVQPWGSMAGAEGASARRSILADYSACLPLQSTWRALGNGHWRAAVTSMMAVLSAAIPVLAGGLFMALTSPDGRVRMFPSMPVLGVLLALVVLYVGNLCLLVPRRRQFLLPHAVESVAAMVSLCSAEATVGEAAWRMASSRSDLAARLGVRKGDEGEESVWFFGLLPGKDEQRPSVRRWRRFTEKGGREGAWTGRMA
ncbi:hypothetical protein L249_4689 [Ophiocordyceps polyrhachis-furcata BCC 54312]|uniref:Phosphoribosylaminoimidazole-succinocarboxamide synthase n=1 Tax=Ophiocordyceps polyrhachis-furcata BCC 54312 TaxID=1330021 RepID=A0A367L2I4_9HYPO|nr:hypothetical protein L249_4689 [Ophiocordyceps polyrhachis-furcata BCC 54312]